MKYISTRGQTAPKSFSEVLLMGLAPDGGLMLPERYPQVDAATLQRWRGLSYAELAFEIMSLFIDDIPAADLRRLVGNTYTEAVFGTREITPVRTLSDGIKNPSPVQRPHAGLQRHGHAISRPCLRICAGA